MAASFDVAASTQSKGAGTTLSWSITATAGARLGVVAGIGFDNDDPSAATWGGVAMTSLLTVLGLRLFIIVNPLTGAQTVVVSGFTEANPRAAAALSVLGSAPGTIPRSSNTGSLAAGGTLTVALASALTADLVVHAAGLDSQGAGATGAVSFTEGETLRTESETVLGTQNVTMTLGTKAGGGGATNVGHSQGNKKLTCALAVKYSVAESPSAWWI